MKPIIGIVGRIEKIDNKLYNPNAMSVIDDYRRAVISSKGNPIMILPTENIKFSKFFEENLEKEKIFLDDDIKEDLISQIKLCDGIILPGGCKIFEYDKFICKYALDNNIPILGICLGMETMAAIDCFNEKVISEIVNGVNHKSLDLFAHDVIVDKNSKLYEMVKNERFKVNSRHKCNVTKVNNFKISSKSPDGIIESIEDDTKKFAIGLQWHPESIYDESIEAKRVFDSFINACLN